jgi:hypothetical protein
VVIGWSSPRPRTYTWCVATVRIASVFSTGWHGRDIFGLETEKASGAATVAELARFFGGTQDVDFIVTEPPVAEVEFPRLADRPNIGGARVIVCLFPQWVTVVLVLEVARVPLANADARQSFVDLLGGIRAGALRIEGSDFEDYLERQLLRVDGGGLREERYQLLYLPQEQANEISSRRVLNDLIRGGDDTRPSALSSLTWPEDLNDATGGSAVVGRWTSVLVGHERVVEHSALASAVSLVGLADHLRQIGQETRLQLRIFQKEKRTSVPGLQERRDLEVLIENLANLQLDLVQGVVRPEPRIAAFHRALDDALEVSGESAALSRGFGELSTSLGSELTAIDIRERRQIDAEKNWNLVSGIVLSPISAAGFVLAFLGINASQVDDRSMWSDQYAPLYFIAALMALTPVALVALPRLKMRSAFPGGRWFRADTVMALSGLVVGVSALLCAVLVSGLDVAAAAAAAIGLVLALLGLASVILRRHDSRIW